MTSNSFVNPSGARPLAPNHGSPKKRPLWLALLAALIIAALIIVGIVLLARHHNKNGNDAASAVPVAASTAAPVAASTAASTPTSDATSGSAADTSSPASTAPAGAPSTTLTAAGSTLLPAASDDNASLASYVGKDAAAKGALVLSSPAANGFWIGTTTKDEVWVQLLLPGLVSPHPVRKGDHVSFPAAVVANPSGFAASAGVTDAEGAARLTGQKAHLQVKKTDITFVG